MVINDSAQFIFISYAHKDSSKVLNIVKKMEEKGTALWYDDRIEPGSEWDENIAAHIKKCMCFVAFVSRNYLNSENCKDELNYARDLSKKQLIVYLEDVSLPDGMAMRMNRLQAVCMYKYEGSQEKGIEKILNACLNEDKADTEIFFRRENTEEEKNTRSSFIKKGQKQKIILLCVLCTAAVCIAVIAIFSSGVTMGSKGENNEGAELINNSLTDNSTTFEIADKMEALSGEELWNAIRQYTAENSDWSEMVPYLEKIAESGDAEACAYLGSYYAEHGGNDKDSAIEWCGKGIDKYNSGYCAYLLAYYYFYGKGAFERPDYVSCLCYADMAVTLEYPDAAYYGAEIYYNGYLGETDTYKAGQYAAIGCSGSDEELAEKCREILEEIK